MVASLEIQTNDFSLQTILGQDVALTYLHRFLQEPERMPHVLLFYGPDGVGKWASAERFSRHLLCLNENSCGICESCRMFMRNQHPDYIQFPHSTSIKIGEPEGDAEPFTIRWLLHHRIPYKPHVSKKRIILFPDASKILPAAETTLLKTLEEPPDHTYFILIVNDLSKIKKTVVSRSVLIPFQLLPHDALKKINEIRSTTGFEYWGGSLNPYDVSEELVKDWEAKIQENCLDPQLLIKLENWIRDTMADSKFFKEKLTVTDFLEIVSLILISEYRKQDFEKNFQRISALLEFKNGLHIGTPAIEPFLVSRLFAKLSVN